MRPIRFRTLLAASLAVLVAAAVPVPAAAAGGDEAWTAWKRPDGRYEIQVHPKWKKAEAEGRDVWTLEGSALAVSVAAWDDHRSAADEEKAQRAEIASRGGKVVSVKRDDDIRGVPTLRVTGEIPAGADPKDATIVAIVTFLEPFATYHVRYEDRRRDFSKNVQARLLASFTSDPERRGDPRSKDWRRRAYADLGVALEAPAAWGALLNAAKSAVRFAPCGGTSMVTIAWVPDIDRAETERSIAAISEGQGVSPKATTIAGLDALAVRFETAKGTTAMAVVLAPGGGGWQAIYSDASDEWKAKTWDRLLASLELTPPAK